MSGIARAEEDLRYATRFVKPILGIVGAWPIPVNSSPFTRLVRRIEHVVTYFLFFLMIVPGLLYVFLKEKNGKIRLKILGPIVNCSIQFFKYSVILYRIDKIQKSLNTIRRDWIEATDENRLIFRSKAKIGRRVLLIAAATMYGGGLCYRTILPLLRGTIVTPDNVTIRPLPCPVYFVFFNEQRSPNYEIVFILQIMAGFVTYAVISGTCGMCALFVLHACSMLRILVNKMNALVDKADMTETLVHRKIADIVEYQTKIKRFLKNIETITEYICLTEMVGGTGLVCLVYYYILMEWDSKDPISSLTYIVLLTSVTFNIFIFCYIGEVLAEQTVKVGEKSYMIDWYRMPGKKGLVVPLMISMSHSTTKITAGNLIVLSISSFGDYEKNINLSIQWNRWLLKPMGLWPNSRTTTRSRKILYKLINALCYGLISFLFVPCSMYVFLEVEDLYDKLKLFGPLIFCVMAFVKYYSLIVHKADIRECVRRIERDWRNVRCEKDREAMIVNANFGRKLVLLCTFFMYSGFVFYYIAIPISVGRILSENGNLTFIPLVFPFTKYIIDTRYTPTNEIVFFLQLIAGALMHGITSAACSLAAAFAVHACGQIEVLMNWLQHLIDGRADMSDTVDGRIASIVSQHVRILKLKILGSLSHWVFCIISYTMLLLRRKTIRHFFNHMETDWRTTTRKEKKEVMLKYAKFSRYAAISCTIFIHGGILGYCVMTASTTMVVVVGNKTTILRVLPLPMYKGLLPVDTNTMNDIVVLSQFLSGFIANNSAISVISLTSALTSHASGQLSVVMLSIEDFVSEARRRGKDDHFDEIPTIVEEHLRVLNCANYTLLLLQGKDIRYCVEHIETDWRMVRREKDQQVMMKNARFGRYVATFCAAIMQSGVFCFFVSSALNTEIIHVGNETTIVRVLPVTVYKKLLNVDQSPTNEIVVFMQTWSSIIATTSTVSIFSLAAVFATHAYGQLTVLMSWITEFVNESRNREKTFPFKQIGVIVEHHLRVLSFISYIEEVMNRICFLELFRCTLAICMLGYYILAVRNKDSDIVYLYMKTKVLGPLTHWFVGCINYTTLLLRGRDILSCVEHVENDWRIITREKDQNVMLRYAKFGRYVAASCAAFVQGGVLCFCLVTVLSTEVIQVGNETRIVHLLPCAVYKELINVNDSPMNEIVLVVQFVSGFIVNSSTVGIFSLAAVLTAHACGQLNVLMEWITEFVDESRNRKKKAPFKEIGVIVEHHLRALTMERIIWFLLIVVCYCLILSTVIPSILHIVLEAENFHMKLQVLGPLGQWFVGMINYTWLLLHSKDIQGCVQHVQEDWCIVTRLEDQRIMLKNAKYGRYVAASCAIFMQTSIMCKCLVTAFTTQVIEDGNETRILRMLPCPVYKEIIPVDTNPTNEIFLATQFLSGFIVTATTVGAFGMTAVFAGHACGQLNVLMSWITEFVNQSRDENKNLYFTEIGVIVEHHLRVLSFIDRIKNVMSTICFVELFKATLDICMLGYYILTEWESHDIQNLTTYFMILISMCGNIFLMCYIGEILTEQCKKVGEVVYMSNWYYLPYKDILDLILIILRSSVVFKFTAGKILHMSMYTFKHMQTDWRIVTRPEDKQVMLKNARIGRYIAIFCAAFMQCGVLGYCVITAFTMQTVEVGNETRIVHLLPCAVYKKMIAVDTSPTNEIVLVSQFVSGFIVNSSVVGAFSLAAVFAAHACGQLSVLMMWIKEFVNRSRDSNKNVCFDKIGVVVEHHLRVLSFIARIESVMSEICFMELFKCTMDICVLSYYILTEWTDHDFQSLTTYFMILISMTFNIFIVCYIGEILTERCKKIGEVVYMTNWYYLPGKDILDLILIISRCSVVIKITAGRIVPIFILSTVIPSIFHIILVDESLHLKLKLLGPLGHWFIGGINYTTLLLRSKEIRGCVEHMQTDWRIVTRPEDQQVMLKNAKIGRYVAIFCAAFMQCGVLCYCVITAFTMQTVQVGNETRTVHMLPCKAYKKIVAVDTSPTNEIVLASQFVSGFIVNSSAVGAFSLAAVFAAHAYGQLSVLMIWITEFVNHSRDQNKNVYFSEIGVVVEHHLRVLSFIARIEDVMNRICFMELFKCTLDMCMLGYYILTEWSDSDVQTMTTHFMILISMCFNIFTVCYIGEILTEQCKKVGEVVYMTNWYYLPDKDILNLLLIISRSSLVIKITAGKLIQMSVYTFGDVIKTTFAYLNILRQTT
ncbi:Odorant receptor 2a [Habropoda laboriosa]|uniref:Odorant receptor 2a n=1 Tax=Habropoda laboriosa TaxID=597456 RepID=A0A0L7QMG3_9HYME|nr:Odorant receptor 2a [Habropoda laboriosa]